jgi:hypothetical protein
LDADIALPLHPLDAELGSGIAHHLSDLDSQDIDGRLMRLEVGLMRLERLSVQSVKTLQALVTALTRPRDDSTT